MSVSGGVEGGTTGVRDTSCTYSTFPLPHARLFFLPNSTSWRRHSSSAIRAVLNRLFCRMRAGERSEEA